MLISTVVGKERSIYDVLKYCTCLAPLTRTKERAHMEIAAGLMTLEMTKNVDMCKESMLTDVECQLAVTFTQG